MPVGCQSEEVGNNCDGKNEDEGAEKQWTATFIYRLQSFVLQSHPVYIFLCCERSKQYGAIDFHILT